MIMLAWENIGIMLRRYDNGPDLFFLTWYIVKDEIIIVDGLGGWKCWSRDSL
jgi:hypothetical protein